MAIHAKTKMIANDPVAPGHCRMVLAAPQIAAGAKPGQFVHVRCIVSSDPLLRRPISISGVDRIRGEITLLYRVVGRGTKLLSQMQPGAELDVIGPLGHGFNLPGQPGTVILVGGGIGTAPLIGLAEALRQRENRVYALLGAANRELVLGIDEFRRLGIEVRVATDDGSEGHQGLVTDLLAVFVKQIQVDVVYACGPRPMLKTVRDIVAPVQIPCEISLEERMGCGVGACLSCVCKVRDEAKGGYSYKRVCVDGPVFAASEVLFDEQ